MDGALLLSWTLFGFTATNLWLVGNKNRTGFIVGLAAQPVWLVFDFMVGAYGLMPLAIILGWLYVRGWLNWGRLAHARPSDVEGGRE